MKRTIGEGTFFRLILPQTQTKKSKILVVDDDQSILESTSKLLANDGYEVEVASGPLMALEKAKTSNYQILLTDIDLPQMNGLELLENFRRITPDICTIFMTGQTAIETAKKAIKIGVYDYILKPFNSDELRDAIKKALKRKLEETKVAGAKELGYLTQLGNVILKSGDKKSIFRIALGFALNSVSGVCGIFVQWLKPSQTLLLTTGSLLDRKFEEFKIILDDGLDWHSEHEGIIETEQIDAIPVLAYLFQNRSKMPWVEPFFEKDGLMVYVPVTTSQTDSSAIILRCNSETQQVQVYEKDLLHFVAQFTKLSLENIELLKRSERAYKELQYLHEQTVELERFASRGIAVAEVAHELNNFLGAMSGQLELMEMACKNKKPHSVEKHLAEAKANLKTISMFAESLQAERKLVSNKQPCDINQIITELVAYTRLQSKFKNIQLEKSLAPLLPHLTADVTQMKQVLYNLLNNAADAMGKREGEGGKVSLRTSFDPDRKLIRVEVADTGVGIPQENLPTIFEKPFTTKSGGHGFGLLVCKKIVDSHGGSIEIDSKSNQGTTIKLTFPV